MDQPEWSKYKCPPDMLTREKANSRLQLTANQLNDQMIMIIDQQLTQAETPEEKQAWANMKAKTQVKKLHKGLKNAFIEDFVLWIDGRSPYNVVSREETKLDKNGVPVVKTVEYTPWGNKSMSFLPGAGEFIAGPIDNRDHVIKELTKLIATNPKNIEDLWYYYKFIVRKVGLDRDENVIKEQNFYNDYDYMEKNPLMVGEGPLYDDNRNIIGVQPELVNDPRYKTLNPNNPKPMPFNPQKYALIKDAVFNEAKSGIINIIDTPEFSGLGAEDKIYMIQVARYFTKVRKDQVEKDKELELDILQKIDTMLPDADINELKKEYKDTYHMISKIQNKKKRKEIHKKLFDRTSVISRHQGDVDLGIKQLPPEPKKSKNPVEYEHRIHRAMDRAKDDFNNVKSHYDDDTAKHGMAQALGDMSNIAREYSKYIDKHIKKLKNDGTTSNEKINALKIEATRKGIGFAKIYEDYMALEEEESNRRDDARLFGKKELKKEDSEDEEEDEEDEFHDPEDDVPEPEPKPIEDGLTVDEREIFKEYIDIANKSIENGKNAKSVQEKLVHYRNARNSYLKYVKLRSAVQERMDANHELDKFKALNMNAEIIGHKAMDELNVTIKELKGIEIREEVAAIDVKLNRDITNVMQATQVKANINNVLDLMNKDGAENYQSQMKWYANKIQELDMFIARTGVKAKLGFDAKTHMATINRAIAGAADITTQEELDKHAVIFNTINQEMIKAIDEAKKEGTIPKILQDEFQNDINALGDAMAKYRKIATTIEEDFKRKRDFEIQQTVRKNQESAARKQQEEANVVQLFHGRTGLDIKKETNEITDRLNEINGITEEGEVKEETAYHDELFAKIENANRELNSANMPIASKLAIKKELTAMQQKLSDYQYAIMDKKREIEDEKAKALSDPKSKEYDKVVEKGVENDLMTGMQFRAKYNIYPDEMKESIKRYMDIVPQANTVEELATLNNHYTTAMAVLVKAQDELIKAGLGFDISKPISKDIIAIKNDMSKYYSAIKQREERVQVESVARAKEQESIAAAQKEERDRQAREQAEIENRRKEKEAREREAREREEEKVRRKLKEEQKQAELAQNRETVTQDTIKSLKLYSDRYIKEIDQHLALLPRITKSSDLAIMKNYYKDLVPIIENSHAYFTKSDHHKDIKAGVAKVYEPFKQKFDEYFDGIKQKEIFINKLEKAKEAENKQEPAVVPGAFSAAEMAKIRLDEAERKKKVEEEFKKQREREIEEASTKSAREAVERRIEQQKIAEGKLTKEQLEQSRAEYNQQEQAKIDADLKNKEAQKRIERRNANIAKLKEAWNRPIGPPPGGAPRNIPAGAPPPSMLKMAKVRKSVADDEIEQGYKHRPRRLTAVKMKEKGLTPGAPGRTHIIPNEEFRHAVPIDAPIGPKKNPSAFTEAHITINTDSIPAPIPIEKSLDRRSEAGGFPTEAQVTARITPNETKEVTDKMAPFYEKYNESFTWVSGQPRLKKGEVHEDPRVTNRKLHILSDQMRRQSDFAYTAIKNSRNPTMAQYKYYYEVVDMHKKISVLIKELQNSYGF